MNKTLVIVLCIALIIVGGVAVILANKGGNQPVTNTYNKDLCWNHVFLNSNTLFWKDGCKGAIISLNTVCTQVIVELTSKEKAEYIEWIKDGSKLSEICQSTAAINPLPKFSKTEVANSNTLDNCLVIRENIVYRISESFILTHPGGFERLSEQCGNDITSLFALEHSKNSNSVANENLVNFLAGVLKD